MLSNSSQRRWKREGGGKKGRGRRRQRSAQRAARRHSLQIDQADEDRQEQVLRARVWGGEGGWGQGGAVRGKLGPAVSAGEAAAGSAAGHGRCPVQPHQPAPASPQPGRPSPTCTPSAASITGLRPQLRSMRSDSTQVWNAKGTCGRSASTTAAASLAARASGVLLLLAAAASCLPLSPASTSHSWPLAGPPSASASGLAAYAATTVSAALLSRSTERK